MEERFWEKVDRTGGNDSCWPWLACVNDAGYGIFFDGKRNVRAHRFAHGQFEDVSDLLQIDHLCHNGSSCIEVPCEHRKCCNPRHLEAVTQRENIARGNAGIRSASRTHCPAGHEYTIDNTVYPLRPSGKRNERVCRECRNAAQRKYNVKRKAT